MRVAVVVSTFPPYQGGMGNVAAAHAEALRRAGHEVTVFAPGAGLRPLLRIGNAAVAPQLLWKLRGFDAVELHYPFFGGVEWVWLWKKLFGKRARLALMYHMDTVGRGFVGAIFRLYRAALLRPIVAASDSVMVSSLDYFGSSQISFLRGDARVSETPLGVDVDFFHPENSEWQAKLLFVGALDSAHYFKGVSVLLRAFAHVVSDRPETVLEIVGDGDLRASYEAEAAALRLGDRVRFLGRVSNERLAAIYRGASAHVLPSIDRSEAFGLVTLAAAASGIPSVVSDLPGVRSLVEPGVTGLVVPPGDAVVLAGALLTLISDPDRTRAMGGAARDRAVRMYASETTDKAAVKAVCG